MTRKTIRGGVCAARDFLAAATAAGIKRTATTKRDDMALVVSLRPATAAATFTTNKIKAAPVRLSMEHLKTARTIRAVLLNSGNANACTGGAGLRNAARTAEEVARALDTDFQNILVCSTGRIGVPLPMDKMLPAIPQLVASLSRKGAHAAARAIMTSDSVPKECAVDCGKFRIGGMAKGAGMIDPNMATMLSVITTDAAVPKPLLARLLRQTVDKTFNSITVDGDMSTNDTVILLANGAADYPIRSVEEAEKSGFLAALEQVCLDLALKIVRDGEGITRCITVDVRGAKTARDAKIAAEAVANSKLVKCAWAGGDPNWGRILDALGYSGADVSEERVDIFYDGAPVALGGMAAAGSPIARIKKIAAKKEFNVTIDLNNGDFSHRVYTTDLTEEYVRLNLSE